MSTAKDRVSTYLRYPVLAKGLPSVSLPDIQRMFAGSRALQKLTIGFELEIAVPTDEEELEFIVGEPDPDILNSDADSLADYEAEWTWDTQAWMQNQVRRNPASFLREFNAMPKYGLVTQISINQMLGNTYVPAYKAYNAFAKAYKNEGPDFAATLKAYFPLLIQAHKYTERNLMPLDVIKKEQARFEAFQGQIGEDDFDDIIGDASTFLERINDELLGEDLMWVASPQEIASKKSFFVIHRERRRLSIVTSDIAEAASAPISTVLPLVLMDNVGPNVVLFGEKLQKYFKFSMSDYRRFYTAARQVQLENDWNDYYSEQLQAEGDGQSIIDLQFRYIHKQLKDKFPDSKLKVNGPDYKTDQLVLDSSITPPGAELVSRVFSGIDEPLEWLDARLDMIEDDEHMETNHSTGLHVSIGSWPTEERLNVAKMLLLLDDAHMLRMFGRTVNQYVGPVRQDIINALRTDGIMALVKDGSLDKAIQRLNNRLLDSATKYRSANLSKLRSHGFIEFRVMGGHYNSPALRQTVKRTIAKFIFACLAASDDKMFQREFYIKLVKIMGDPRGDDPYKELYGAVDTRIEDLAFRKVMTRVIIMTAEVIRKDNVASANAFLQLAINILNSNRTQYGRSVSAEVLLKDVLDYVIIDKPPASSIVLARVYRRMLKEAGINTKGMLDRVLGDFNKFQKAWLRFVVSGDAKSLKLMTNTRR